MDAHQIISKLKARLQDENLVFWWFENIFKVCGCWPSENVGILFSLRKIGVYCNLFACIFAPVMLFTPKLEGVIDIVKSTSSILIATNVFAYTLVMHFREDDIKTCIENLAKIRPPAKSMSDSETSIRKRNQRLTTHLLVFANVCLLAMVIAFFLMFKDIMKTRSYPVKLWAPYDASLSPNFEITMIFGFYIAMFNFTFMPWSISFQVYIYIFLIGEFKILREKFENIRVMASENVTVKLNSHSQTTDENGQKITVTSVQDEISGKQKTQCQTSSNFLVKQQDQILSPIEQEDFESEFEQAEDDSSSKENMSVENDSSLYLIDEVSIDNEMLTLLRQYIQEHQTLLEYLSQHEFFLGAMLLADSLFCLLLSVLTVFLSTKLVERDPLDVIVVFGNLSLLHLLYIKCYLVDRLSTETLKVRDAAYACAWQDASEEFKRNLRVVITRANVPFVLSGLGFVDFSMGTFVSIISTAFSYFTVIVDLDSNSNDPNDSTLGELIGQLSV